MFDSKRKIPKNLRARLWRCLIGAALLAFAIRHASEGLEWSRSFHPDELVIARWIYESRQDGYVSERAYPGGWFVLINIWQRAGSACDAATRLWRGDIPPPLRGNRTMLGRRFNLRLFALAVLFLYLAALEAGAGPAAAGFAALLFATHPFPLEHVHYCETDMAVPFTLCLSGWLAMRAIRLQSRGWYIAAMFATGFAIACKYTLLPAVLWPIAVAPAVVRSGERRLGRSAMLAAAGVVFLAAGFLIGTPALWMNFEFFSRSIRQVSQKTYAEGARALGKAFESTWARCSWRARTLVGEMARMGAVTLVFLGASLAVWIARGRRTGRLVFPLFLLVFVPYAVFLMPWIRNQETLPLLPPLCIGAAVAVDWAARTVAESASSARRRVAATALLALACGAFVRSFCDGRRVLTSFSREDTRVAFHDWLRDCAAPDVHLAYDRYTRHSVHRNPFLGSFVPGVVQKWPAVLHEPAFQTNTIRYAIRNASFSGRRVNSVGANARTQAFFDDCLLLRSWTIAPGRIRTTTFAQPDIELWALPDSGAPAKGSFPPKDGAPDIPVVLDRPVYFPPDDAPLLAAEELRAIGPLRGIPVDGRPRTFYPVPSGDSLVVSRSFAGPAESTVSWRRLAEPTRRALPQGGVALFTMSGAALRRRSIIDVLPTTCVRLVDADDSATFCATWPVADRAEAARALRRGGDAAGALALLRDAPSLDDAERSEAFLAAVDARETPEPAWEASARNLIAAIDSALPRDGGAVDGSLRVRGLPLRVARDFANLKLSSVPLLANGAFPLLLPAGTYRATLIATRKAAAPESRLWLEGQTAPAVPRADAKGYTWWDATIVLPRESLLRVHPDAVPVIGNGQKGFRELQLSWDPAEQLHWLADELRTALPND